MKSQVIVDKANGKIICVDFGKGKQHDFEIFKKSKVKFKEKTKVLADSGYQGIKQIHNLSETPIKNTKNHPLSKAQKATNRQLSSARVLNENVIGKLKRFKIIAQRYRNRRKRFSLRFNLIAGIYNFELAA